MESSNNKLNKILNICYYIAIFILLIWIISFRTEIWLHKGALFHDEIALLLNIKERSFFDLFKTLDYVQCCPTFFLLFNKIVYNIYGLNEIALCFYPFIFGIFSLLLIPFLSNKIFKLKAFSFLFLVLWGYNNDAILLSQNFKQYSSDAFCVLLIIYLFITLKDTIKTNKQYLFLSSIFGLSVFVSFTAQFLIFPIYIYFLIKAIKEKNIKKSILLTLPYMLILGIEFLLIGNSNTNGLGEFWSNTLPIYHSYTIFSSTLAELITLFVDTNFIFILIITGLIVTTIQNKQLAFILISPIILNIFAQILGIYPCPEAAHNRVIFYMAPLLTILCLKSLEIIFFFNKSNKIKYILSFLILVLSILLFGFIMKIQFFQKKIYIGENYYYFIATNVKEYINHIKTKKFESSDKIVVDKMGHLSFNFYTDFKYKDNIIQLADDLIPLDPIEKDTKIWFYNTQYMGISDNWMKELKYWIHNNSEVIIHEKDDMGELYYVRKIN